MVKITISSDIDKADLIAQYQAGLTRLDEIVTGMNTINSSALSTDAAKIAAIKGEALSIRDEAIILKRALIILKKIVMHEIN